MKTSELITFLKSESFTTAQAYNLIVADMFEFNQIKDVAAASTLTRYFCYKIQEVLLPAIQQLKTESPK